MPAKRIRAEGRRKQPAARARHDCWARLENGACPVWLAGGLYDGIAKPDTMRGMAARLPDARLDLYEGGHLFMLQDGKVFPDLLAFFEKHMTQDLLPDGCTAIDSGAARLVAGYRTTEKGAVGHLRFNLPEKHNVIDLEGWQAIAGVMAELAGVDNMRLIVLRGIGGRAFVAGADIAQFEQVLSGPGRH